MNEKKYAIIFFLLLAIQAEIWSSSIIKKAPLNAEGLFAFVLPESGETTSNVSLIKYDASLYELAYVIYLQNKNIKDAYTVAAAAVAQNPQSKLWRNRLAQVAIWEQEPAVALQQYEYLAQKLKDHSAEIKGLILAKNMHDDEVFAKLLLLNIERGNSSDKNWEDYVNSMLRLGEIKRLTHVLNENQNKISAKLYLESFLKLYLIIDNPKKQLQILKRLSAKTGNMPIIAEQLSKIYLNQGTVDLAFKTMNQTRKKAKDTDYEFWDAYAKVSYLANKRDDELYAYQQLVKQKKPDVSIYTKLVTLSHITNPQLAHQYAIEGRIRYPNDYPLTLDALSLLNNKNLSLDFPRLLASIPKSVLSQLKYDSIFWDVQANYWKIVGNDDQVIQSYLSGINYSSSDDYLKSNLIYFLIGKNNTALLRQVLPWWQRQIPSTPKLWGAYAQGYAQLNNPTMSGLILSLFYEQFPSYKNSPLWLISFKDILENSNFPIAAAEVTHYAWPVYLNYLREQSTPPNYKQIINYAKLSMQEASGDPTAVALNMLQDHVNEDVELLILTWALKHNNFSLARATYWHYLVLGIEPPLWASLSIALERHDRKLERKIITDKKNLVSYRDHIRASIDIDAIPHGQTMAFKELAKHRHDHDFYDNFFVPIMFKTTNNFSISQEYYQYGNVEGPRTNLSYTYFLMPSIRLTPYNSTWFSRNIPGGTPTLANNSSSNSNQALATVPPHDERAGVIIHKQQQRGTLDLNVGYRDNLASFLTSQLTRTYPFYNDLNASVSLGYHQQADDTAGLLVGGMKNDLSLGLSYNLFAKDTLFGSYTQNAYYTQDGQYVSNGEQAVIRYEHKFWKSYPDWTIAPYSVVTQYYNKTKSLLTGSILQLVPTGVVPNVNFLIPANFIEYGLTFSFGQTYIEDYTHRWRPMGSLTLSKNSSVGPGKLFNLGIAGTVFGRDHLLFYYEWGSNQGQGLQTSRLIKASYRLYM
jgi:hypothetical protein